MAASNELRVFISSTFRDLQEEREHLVKKIFPEIRALCRERGITFTDIDLRWGLTEQDAMLGQVIRTCLEEVDKCRPYFIGLIGSRYGWVPEFHEILMDPELLAKYPWIEDVVLDGASVTEMEFIHGVFDAAEVEGECAFFYHRQSEETVDDDPVRLAALIDRVRATGRPYHDFQTSDELGEMVRDDLLAMIERCWPQHEVPSALEVERRSHASFAASRIRAYIPNPVYLSAFTSWLGESSKPLVIGGDSGLGKSSLLAYLVGYYRKKNPTALIVEHYVGAFEGSGSEMSVMRHVIEEIRERFGIDEPAATTPQEVEASFPGWLYRAEHLGMQKGVPIIIVVDAVNQLGESGQRLSWLPRTMPAGVKLLISTTPDEVFERLKERDWELIEVTPLDDERVRQSIIVRYLGEYHKGISPAQVRRVAGDPKARSPLYLRVVTEELRLHGEHETLDAMIARYSDAVDLLAVFDRVLDRIEEDYGTFAVREILSLIGSSRRGLSEVELLELTGISRIYLSRLLFAFDYHLLHRDGLLGFFHDYLRRAVYNRYLADEPSRSNIHRRLATYFEHQAPSQRSTPELCWQLHQAGEQERLASVLSTIPHMLVLFLGEARYELLKYWSELGNTFDIEAMYRAALDQDELGNDETDGMAVVRVSNLLESLGRWNGAEQLKRRWLDRAIATGDLGMEADARASLGNLLLSRGEYLQAFAELVRARELSQAVGDRRGLAVALANIGVVFAERGEHDRAMECFSEWQHVCSDLGDRNGAAGAMINIGILHHKRGELDRALECYHNGATIFRELDNRNWLKNAIINMGMVLSARGELDSALDCFVEQESVCRELGDRHGVAQALGNKATVFLSRGDIDRAQECYNEKENICIELGDRNGLAGAISGTGNVHRMRGVYQKALLCWSHSATEYRALGKNYDLVGDLIGIVDLVVELVEGENTMPEGISCVVPGATVETWKAESLRMAREQIAECIELSEGISRPDTGFDARLLLARINAAEGNASAAETMLQEMLSNASDDDQRARLHYWLSRCLAENHVSRGESREHSLEALRLYRSLNLQSARLEYRRRIDELRASLGTSADEATRFIA